MTSFRVPSMMEISSTKLFVANGSLTFSAVYKMVKVKNFFSRIIPIFSGQKLQAYKNVGFFIVLIDFIGYLGTVIVLAVKEFLNPDMPPVWHVGECIDNTRSSGIFAGIANAFGKAMYEMPFAFASPEWSNEKGIDAALGFRLNGISSYHCVEAPIHGSSKVIEFLKEGTKETLHQQNVQIFGKVRAYFICIKPIGLR